MCEARPGPGPVLMPTLGTRADSLAPLHNLTSTSCLYSPSCHTGFKALSCKSFTGCKLYALLAGTNRCAGVDWNLTTHSDFARLRPTGVEPCARSGRLGDSRQHLLERHMATLCAAKPTLGTIEYNFKLLHTAGESCGLKKVKTSLSGLGADADRNCR